MAEPITISGQTFVKTDKGWVDKKTKVVAPEGLITLLERMSTGEPVKKLRVKIDRSRGPVTISGQKYVFDSNQNAWVTDDAMRWRPPDSMQRVIEEALKQTLGENADQIVSKMGTIGQVAKSTVKKPDGTKTPVNIKINSPIVSMIEKLATIDGYLKQRLDNQKKIAARNISATKESAIESSPADASPTQEIKKEDATKSNAGNIAAALLIGGLIASQFEPVQEAFKTMIDGVKGVFNFVNDVAKSIADGLDFFTGSSTSTSPDAAPNSVPAPTSNVNGASPSTPNVVETPSVLIPSETNKAEETVIGTPQNNTVASSQPPAKNQSSKANSPTVGTSSAASSSASSASASSVAPSSSSKSTGRSSAAAPSSSASPTISNSASPATSNSATPVQPSAPAATSSKDATQQKSAQTTDASKIDGTNYSGLTMKNLAENTGGGPAAENTIKFAKIVQPGLGNMFGRFTAFNDRYHQGITEYVSPHTKGIAFDLTVKDPSQASAAANKIKALADENKFKVSILNEYANPTAKSTGGHIHVTVNGPGIGSSVRGGTGMGEPGGDGSALGDVASSLYDLGAGALKAIGNIIGAGLGPQTKRSVTESLSQYAPNTAGEIATASVKRSGDIVAAKTPDVDTSVSVKDPMDLNKNKPTEVVQNVPTSADYAGVDFYLTRMGFPKIEYHAPVKQERMA
jgi:hypothetical protein